MSVSKLSKSWFLYIVRCQDGSLYTGITTDINRRIKMHNNSKGAKYVRTRLPVELIYTESFGDRISAMKREIEIKGWTRERKLRLLVS